MPVCPFFTFYRCFRSDGHHSGGSGGHHSSGGSGGHHSVGGRAASGKGGSGGSDRRSIAGSVGSAGSEGGIIKQLGLYVRVKSDSGKKLSDQEILQQIKVDLLAFFNLYSFTCHFMDRMGRLWRTTVRSVSSVLTLLGYSPCSL